MNSKHTMDDRSQDGKPFGTREEMTAAIRDERYKKDEAFEARVKARMAVTNFEEVTGALINKQHPLSEEGMSDVDQVAPWMPWGYQTVSDFTKIMKSNEYKTNPALRLAIENAIDQATPGWKPRTQEETLRVEVDPIIPGGGFDPNNSPASAASEA